MQETRSEKSETGNKDFKCSHPISHFPHDILRQKRLNLAPRNGKWDSNEDSLD